jgi:hypothetical protein
MRTSVEFSTSEYEFAHGRRPIGRGQWAFMVEGRPDAVWAPRDLTLTEAKAWMRRELAGTVDGVVFVSVGS